MLGRLISHRLNHQHEVLVNALGFIVHPSITVNDEPGFRIADVGCGSGAWIKDLAKQFKHVEFDGFDIAQRTLPLDEELNGFAGRMRFHVQNAVIKGGFGAEYDGKFDVVATRLMHISILGEDWERAVDNIFAMLKPGGYVQWIDWIAQTPKVVQSRPGGEITAMRRLLEGWHAFLQSRDNGATALLAQTLTKKGFEDVSALRSFRLSVALVNVSATVATSSSDVFWSLSQSVLC
jgi:SAM-dependent methyltransferase